MWARELGLSGVDAALIVVTTVGIYAAVILLTRIAGQRSLSSFSSFDFAVTIAMGAIIGRTVLVRTSLLGGVVGLAMLFVVQAGVGLLRSRSGAIRVVDNDPILLMAGRSILHDNLRRARLSEEDLFENLRSSGVARLDEVRAAVLERSGGISVIKGDQPVDPTVLGNVRGRENLESEAS